MRRPKTSFGLELWGPLFLDNGVGTAKGGAHDISVDRVFDAVARSGTAVVAAVRVRWIQYENWTLKRRLQDAENNYDYMCSQYKGVALQALTTSMSSLLCCRGKFKGLPVQGLPWT
ncbi:hypothetical protein ISCGN_029731 [Ixodes scapularis]